MEETTSSDKIDSLTNNTTEIKKDHCAEFFKDLNVVEDVFLKAGFGSLIAALSVLGSLLLFLIIVLNRKLRITFRCQFLPMFLCDMTLAMIFIISKILYVISHVTKSMFFLNLQVRLFPFGTSLEDMCASASDFLLISATVEVLVRILGKGSHGGFAIARWFGIGFSIVLAFAIQYPLLDNYKIVSFTGYCDEALYVTWNHSGSDDYTSAFIRRIFLFLVHPLLTTFMPFLIQVVLLGILGRQVKIQPESGHPFRFAFPLLCTMTFARIAPDMIPKFIDFLIYASPMRFTQESYMEILSLHELSIIFVEFTRVLSYVALVYFDRDLRKALPDVKVVQLPLKLMDAMEERIPYCPITTAGNGSSEKESRSELLKSFDTEMDAVSCVSQA